MGVMLRMLAGIFACAFFATASAAAPIVLQKGAAQQGGGGGGGGFTIAGAAVQPEPVPGAGISTFNDITPIHYGSSGDYGYSLGAIMRWDDIPYVEVGQSPDVPGIGAKHNGVRHIGVLCAHAPSDQELIAGSGNNVTDVLVRVDGGAWYKITDKSANPDAGNYQDFNFIVESQNYTDGVHRVDAVCEMSTGVSTIMEGPEESADGTHHLGAATGQVSGTNIYDPSTWSACSGYATIDNGAGSAGNVLTVVGGTCGGVNANLAAYFQDGWSISGRNVAPNTFVDKTAADDPTYTGTGGSGTYHVTGSPQLAAKIPMTSGEFKSFYFITDYNGTIVGPNNVRGAHIIYVCNAAAGSGSTCPVTGAPGNAVNGNDGNNGQSQLAPVLTTKKARGLIWTNDAATHGKYGGVVCLMNSGIEYTDTGIGNEPAETAGFIVNQDASKAPCGVPGDPGDPVMQFNSSYRTYGGQRVWYKYITADGPPDTLSAGSTAQLVLERSTVMGRALNNQLSGNNDMLGAGGYACLESTSYVTYGGCQGALVRGSTEYYGSEDCYHGPQVVVNSGCVGFGPMWNFPMKGTVSSLASGDIVVSGLPVIPNVPASLQTLSRWFSTTGAHVETQDGCLDGAVSSVDDTNLILHTAGTPTCTTTNEGLMWSDVSGKPHGDNIQFQSGGQFNDLYIADNIFNDQYPNVQQGLFIETTFTAGAYIARNHFNQNYAGGDQIANVNGGNDNFILDQNQFTGLKGGSFDYQGAASGTGSISGTTLTIASFGGTTPVFSNGSAVFATGINGTLHIVSQLTNTNGSSTPGKEGTYQLDGPGTAASQTIHAVGLPTTNETLNQDTCPSAGHTFGPAYSVAGRSHSASANACY